MRKEIISKYEVLSEWWL